MKLSRHPHVDKKYFGYHYRGEHLRQVLQLYESYFLIFVRQWLNCLKNKILRLNQQKHGDPAGVKAHKLSYVRPPQLGPLKQPY